MPFHNFSIDMLDRISSIIDRIERSPHPLDRMANVWLSEVSLDWLLVQNGFFKLSHHDSTTSKWKSLHSFIKTSSELLEIGRPVMGAFYNTYGSTGTFILNRRMGQPSGDEYFMVMADELDPPIYWPLVTHELSHCWLSSQSIVEEISSQVHPEELETRFVERRVEEALCDAVATSLMGPSYIYSYINRLWSSFMMQNSQEYPNNSFRLELMIRILKQTNHEEVSELESMIEETTSMDWEDEAIVDSMILMEDFMEQLPLTVRPEDLGTEIRNIDEFVETPPSDLQKLYHVGWTLLNLSDAATYSDHFNRINLVIQEKLERNSSAFNT